MAVSKYHERSPWLFKLESYSANKGEIYIPKNQREITQYKL